MKRLHRDLVACANAVVLNLNLGDLHAVATCGPKCDKLKYAAAMQSSISSFRVNSQPELTLLSPYEVSGVLATRRYQRSCKTWSRWHRIV